MASIHSAVTRHLAQSFTIFIPQTLQSYMDRLPAATSHALLGELYRIAVEAGQERDLLPRQGPVILQFMLADCDVNLELDVPRGQLTLVALERPLE